MEDVPPESTFKLSKIGGRLEKEADVINQFLYSPEGPFFGEEQNGPEGGGDLCDERGSSASPPSGEGRGSMYGGRDQHCDEEHEDDDDDLRVHHVIVGTAPARGSRSSRGSDPDRSIEESEYEMRRQMVMQRGRKF